MILVRPDIDTADGAGFAAASGALTAMGGCTAHASLIARQMGKPCVVSCAGLEVDAAARRAKSAPPSLPRATGSPSTEHVGDNRNLACRDVPQGRDRIGAGRVNKPMAAPSHLLPPSRKREGSRRQNGLDCDSKILPLSPHVSHLSRASLSRPGKQSHRSSVRRHGS